MIKRLDIVSTYIAYVEDVKYGKVRPILVTRVLDKGQILRAILITSKYKGKNPVYQKQRYLIQDWRSCGLREPSYIDVTKHCTLMKHAFQINKIGQLSLKDTKSLLRFELNYQSNK